MTAESWFKAICDRSGFRRDLLSLAAMIALLVAMDYALLPKHADLYIPSVGVWGWLCVAICAFNRSRDWPKGGR